MTVDYPARFLEYQRSNAQMWFNAVHVQAERVRSNPLRTVDPSLIAVELHFYLDALVRLRRAVKKCRDMEPLLRSKLDLQLQEFDLALPGLKRMRDISQHADEYVVGDGRRAAEGWAGVQVFHLSRNDSGGMVWNWIGEALDIDRAYESAIELWQSFRDELRRYLRDPVDR